MRLPLDKWAAPLFLCPLLAQAPLHTFQPTSLRRRDQPCTRPQCRKQHVASFQPVDDVLQPELQSGIPEEGSTLTSGPLKGLPSLSLPKPVSPALLKQLPWSCPGCGAYTQLVEPDEAGYYSLTRKSVRSFLKAQRKREGAIESGQEILHHRAGPSGTLPQLLNNSSPKNSLPNGSTKGSEDAPSSQNPICNRCNTLLHHHSGTPIIHPTLHSLQAIFSESPHKYNHIYHVLDAADFPLSLIPQIHNHLSLSPQRSHNRRSKTIKYTSGRTAELSFIITRSDLLAPKKEQVDTLMPYLVQVLRDALGSAGRDVRLGNVRCVSAKRGWWTKNLKEDVLARGGGTWMVGKVNVGKSNLFEVIFPKGHGEDVDIEALREEALETKEFPVDEEKEPPTLLLLPPPAPFKPFPTMPIVSSLPGTTVSPIRLPFANSRGELVDLPGLPRHDLSPYVLPEHQSSLVMESRITARQHVIKADQSLLVGGIIRISLANVPHGSDLVLLAAPFVPLKAHVGLAEKMVGVQSQQIESGIESIASPGVGKMLASAGKFALEWDVTKVRSGVLTEKQGIGLKAARLPYVVFSADILIEGCGWIECTVQVRRRALEEARLQEDRTKRERLGNNGIEGGVKQDLRMEYGASEHTAFMSGTPFVEVWSPEGKGIGIRRPMGAYVLGGEGSKPRERTSRPRRSMKGVKKRLKAEGRRKNVVQA